MAAAAIAAGAVRVPPADGQAAPPPGRVAVDAALTRLSRPDGQAALLAADERTIPRNSPVVHSLKYLQWRTPGDNGPSYVAATEIQGVCILVCKIDLADQNVSRALSEANLLEHALSDGACSRILRELHESRVFDCQYQSEGQLLEALADNTIITPERLALQLADIVATDPFDTPGIDAVPARPAGAGRRGAPAVPAVVAVPAQPGPPELKGIQLTTWLAVLAEGERQLPGQQTRLLARTFALLSHRSLDAVRRNANSDVRTVTYTLTTYVGVWSGIGSQATSAQVARQVPAYLASNMSVMPADLVGPCGTAISCESELRDGHTLLCGRESEAASVLWRRIHHNIDRFPVLDQFKGRLNSSGATKEVLERLMIGINIP